MHGTSAKNFLEICCSGKLLPGPGIVGLGVYAFALRSMDPDDVMAAYDRCARGGYNGGAAIIMETDGILFRGLKSEDDEIPAGAIAISGAGVNINTQFAAHPQSVQLMAAVVDFDSVCHVLGKQLDALGYSEKLHQALS